jgi:RHS repeat-associated protein
VEYFYDGNAVLDERNSSDNSLLAHYRYGHRQISLETGTERQYYHHDAFGSTVNLTDSTGGVKVSYTLDPWGHIKNQTGESVNRQIFTGQEHDGKTGLINFGARYYDPDAARFITQDAYLGEAGTSPSLHRYLYAYGNPTVYIDPDGHIAFLPLLGYAAWTAVMGYEGHAIYQELSGNLTSFFDVDHWRAARFGLATGGTVLSGGTLGIPATAMGIGAGAVFDVAQQSAYEGRTLSGIDYEHALTTGGMFAPFGLLGKEMQSSNALISGVSRVGIGGLSALGVGTGAEDVIGGVRKGNWAQAFLGVSEMALGSLGLRDSLRRVTS